MKDSSQSKELAKAAEIIKKGGVVVFPTDTVYGIGANFADQQALEKIYKIKGTEKKQQFPVLVKSISQAQEIVDLGKTAQDLAEKYWPGGLTIIAQSKSTKGKIGVRQPNHVVPVSIIKMANTPIIGTSANFHGQKTPTNMGDLDPKFTKLVDYVVLGECKNAIESTVVDTTVDPPKILRQGAVKLDI